MTKTQIMQQAQIEADRENRAIFVYQNENHWTMSDRPPPIVPFYTIHSQKYKERFNTP